MKKLDTNLNAVQFHLSARNICGMLSVICVCLFSTGCSKPAPEATPQEIASSKEQMERRIQQVQNDSGMSPQAKQQAIAVLKSRQGVATQK